jgi:hypothetical protein
MFPWWMPFLLERHFNKYRRELSVEELAVIELMRSIFAASLMLVVVDSFASCHRSGSQVSPWFKTLCYCLHHAFNDYRGSFISLDKRQV